MVRFWRLFAALLLILTATQGIFGQRGPLRVSVTPASYTVPKGASAQMGANFFFLGARASAGGAGGAVAGAGLITGRMAGASGAAEALAPVSGPLVVSV